MYPVVPIGTLGNELARTGFPVAALLWIATVLIVSGLFLLRASVVLRRPASVPR